MSGVAWDELLKLGIGDMKLTPDVFWSLTPVELLLLSGNAQSGGRVLEKSAMQELMARFPDQVEKD